MVLEDVIEIYSANEMSKLKNLCYPIMIKIGGICDLDYDDFYSIANETLWTAARNFNEEENDNFEAFLRNCIKNKFCTEMTKRNREKRISHKHIDSLDRNVSEDSETTFGETIASDFCVENYISEFDEEENNVAKYLNSLSSKQKKIAKLILDGYNAEEIKRILNLSSDKYRLLLDGMRTFDKKLIIIRH